MLAFLVRRLLTAILTLWAISILTFLIIQLPPGDYVTSYIAQLQATGGAVDHRTDLWSLGVVLHEMLAGKPPFAAPTIEQLFRAVRGGETPLVRDARPEVPERVQEVVSRLLQRDPAEPYPDAQSVAEALGG